MQISPSVRAAMVPDENPMHPDFTSIYLVGPEGGQSLTFDSGEAIDRYLWFLRGYLGIYIFSLALVVLVVVSPENSAY